ncbi:MAG TPA: hypothetical protein VF823_02425 [Anaerolineales bacterium]
MTPISIYSTRGDVGAFLIYPYIYNRSGEWIGWVTPDRLVYSVRGTQVGWLTDEPRILRKASADPLPSQPPPPVQASINVPALVPLAPMMAELTFGTIDVLDEAPELLPSIDFDELCEDLD